MEHIHHDLQHQWEHIQFGEVIIEKTDQGHLFHVQVKLNGISSGNILVELYAEGLNGQPPVRIRMKSASTSAEHSVKEYEAQVNGSRPLNDYTARIIPDYESISMPLEDNLILWQH